ncbi:MAG: hypothetical protein ACRYG4_07185 [Janthinobacterium lividum]
MVSALFNFAAFAAMTLGLVLAAVLFTGLAIVVAASGSPRHRRRSSRRLSKHVLARTPRFDLAIDSRTARAVPVRA